MNKSASAPEDEKPTPSKALNLSEELPPQETKRTDHTSNKDTESKVNTSGTIGSEYLKADGKEAAPTIFEKMAKASQRDQTEFFTAGQMSMSESVNIQEVHYSPGQKTEEEEQEPMPTIREEENEHSQPPVKMSEAKVV